MYKMWIGGCLEIVLAGGSSVRVVRNASPGRCFFFMK